MKQSCYGMKLLNASGVMQGGAGDFFLRGDDGHALFGAAARRRFSRGGPPSAKSGVKPPHSIRRWYLPQFS